MSDYLSYSNSEWYKMYDDRAIRYLGKPTARDKAVLIVASNVDTYEDQLMLILSANLIARFCTHVTVGCDDSITHDCLSRYDKRSIRNEIYNTMLMANYRGRYDVVPLAKAILKDYDYVLKVGSGTINLPVYFTVDGSGWQAYFARGGYRFKRGNRDIVNPTGPGAASCIGAADCFRFLNGFDCYNGTEGTFSMFTYMTAINNPATPRVVDLGTVLIVGLGMIGSSVAYFMRKFPFNYGIILVDKDSVKVENLGRSPLFESSDLGASKVDIVKKYLMPNVIDSFPFRYDEAVNARGKRLYADIVIPVANEDGVRRQIQANYPPFMIYASTDRNWGVELGRYIPGQTDCLTCRYPSQDPPIKTSCGKALVVGNGAHEDDVALPFLAPLGGLMVVGEMIKLGINGYPFVKNRVLLNTASMLAYPVHSDRKPCKCALFPDQGTNLTLNGATKFTHLSLPHVSSRHFGWSFPR